MKDKIYNISELLQQLPNESSVVITSPTNILTELFTHNGALGFFLCLKKFKI